MKPRVTFKCMYKAVPSIDREETMIMQSISKKAALVFLTAVLLLAGCSMPGSSSSGGALVWLDQPVEGSLLPLGAFPLKAHARPDGSSGVVQLRFLVNDVPVGSAMTDAGQPIVYAETAWNPSIAGRYRIQAEAFTAKGNSFSETADVCVSALVTTPTVNFNGDCSNPSVPITPTPVPATSTVLPPAPTRTASLTPTRTEAPKNPTVTPVPADTTPPQIHITSVTPSDTAYYITGCGPNSIVVEADATDGSGVASVTLVYQYSGGGSHAVAMSSIGGSSFRGVLAMDMDTYNALKGSDGSVTLSVQAADARGNTASAGAGTVKLMYCPG